MARQIQFRRGTADEHANFTGAEGEITVDTTNKTLRVHDGVTAGGTMLAKRVMCQTPQVGIMSSHGKRPPPKIITHGTVNTKAAGWNKVE